MKELRPTAEVIEAALRAYESRHQEGTPDDDSLDFIRITWRNEQLKAKLLGAVDFVTKIDLPAGVQASFSPEVIQLYKMNMLFHMFFSIGWHSRGALEQTEEVKGLAKTTSQ